MYRSPQIKPLVYGVITMNESQLLLAEALTQKLITHLSRAKHLASTIQPMVSGTEYQALARECYDRCNDGLADANNLAYEIESHLEREMRRGE